jgi:hypothetical protein
MAFFGRTTTPKEINLLSGHINVQLRSNVAETGFIQFLVRHVEASSRVFESRKLPPGVAPNTLLTDVRDMDCLYRAIMYLLAIIKKGLWGSVHIEPGRIVSGT